MKRELVTCDRCSVAASGDRLELAVELGSVLGFHQADVIDLCPECREALSLWLRPVGLTRPPLRRALSAG
jgi:hypothetical protein